MGYEFIVQADDVDEAEHALAAHGSEHLLNTGVGSSSTAVTGGMKKGKLETCEISQTPQPQKPNPLNADSAPCAAVGARCQGRSFARLDRRRRV